jgi:hypothetical protein
MNIKKLIREELEKILETRNPLLNYLKDKLPNTPDYIIKDFFYSNLKNATKEEVFETIKEYSNIKWELKTNFPINYNIFNNDTIKRLKERDGGSKNPYEVPNDINRHNTQKELILKDGLPKEPIILFKDGSKYELVEGWHRTIQLLTMFPKGYKYPNVYIGTKK